MVKDLRELDRYPWSGHSAIMGLNKNDWQEVEEVLLHFSVKEARARRNYRRFVEGGVEQSRGEDPICKRTGLAKGSARKIRIREYLAIERLLREY